MESRKGETSLCPIDDSTTRTLSLRHLLALSSKILSIIFDFFTASKTSTSNIIKITPKSPGHVDDGTSVNQWVEANVPSLRGSFVPSKWLFNGHLQTMYSVAGDFTNVDKVEYARTYLRIPDGGPLGLDFTPPNHEALREGTPTVVVCHGLTGGSHESYVRNVLAVAVRPVKEGGLGLRGVVVNFRGCAGVPITSPQLYSAGTTLDLALSLHFIRSHYPSSPLHSIGFSLGASVLTRYLGESSSSSLLSSGIVIGTPWDLPAMSDTLENHWFNSRIYSSAMGANILRMFFRNYDRNPELFDGSTCDVGRLKAMKGKSRLKAVDELMVAKIGGTTGIGAWPFDGADEYYRWASPNRMIAGVKRPLIAINAFDDPIVDNAAIPIEGIQASSHVYAAVTRGGGHLGWFSDLRTKDRWVRKPICEFLVAAARDLLITDAVVEVEERDGWEWVREAAHEVSGVGGDGRFRWRVLREGEVIEGAEGSGTMQGL